MYYIILIVCRFRLLAEFSESLRELGACLLEKTALNDDEESGKLGKQIPFIHRITYLVSI